MKGLIFIRQRGMFIPRDYSSEAGQDRFEAEELCRQWEMPFHMDDEDEFIENIDHCYNEPPEDDD